MNDRHRREPWRYVPNIKASHTAGQITQNGHLIAIVQLDRGTQLDGMEIVPARDTANGLLLAAAPLMLDALRYAQGAACGGCGDCVICSAVAEAVQ